VSEEPSLDNDALLRRHGLQVTAQRLAVLRAVSERPHRTADDICDAVRAEIGAISRQAVYDALATFTDRGLVRRIQPAGSPARYESRVGDNHHHLICRTCNRMPRVRRGGLSLIRWMIGDRRPGNEEEQPVTKARTARGEGPTCLRVAAKAKTP